MAPRKGTPEFDAWRAKISASQKGRPFTEEHKQALRKPSIKKSIARKGIPRSPETIAKMSAANKGVKWSEEHKKAHSKAMQKRVITPELSAKYSAAKKGKKHSSETRAKISAANTGRPLSEAHKASLRKERPKDGAKYSQGQKSRFLKMSDEERGLFAEKRMKAMRPKDTDIEAFVARQLTGEGISYEPQKRVGRYVVDFLISDQNRIVEVNGCFWHGCEQCGFSTPRDLKRREHDGKRIAFLESKGYIVTVLWQHDLLPLMKAEKRE